MYLRGRGVLVVFYIENVPWFVSDLHLDAISNLNVVALQCVVP